MDPVKQSAKKSKRKSKKNGRKQPTGNNPNKSPGTKPPRSVRAGNVVALPTAGGNGLFDNATAKARASTKASSLALAKGKAPATARQLASALEAFTLPYDSEPVQFGGGHYGDVPTGCARLFHRFKVQFPTVSSIRPMQVFSFRSALRACVYSYYNTAHNVYQATCDVALDPAATSVINPGSLSSGTDGPHGFTLWPGRLGLSDPERGYWADEGSKYTVTVITAVPASGLAVIVKRQEGREWIPVIRGILTNAAGGNVFIQNVLTSGYYSFSLQDLQPANTQAAAVSFSTNLTIELDGVAGPGIAYGQLSLPDMETNLAAVSRLRVNATSVMITNTTALVSRQGQVTGCQLDAGTDWRSFNTYESITDLHKAANMDATEGIYGFLKPSDPDDFTMLNEFTIAAGNGLGNEPNLSDAAFIILPTNDYIVAALSVDAPSAYTGYYTVAYQVEYSSNDQWRRLTAATIPRPVFDAAIVAMGSMPQWHTNEWHFSDLWEDIKSFARNVVEGVQKYAPMAIEAAGMVAPLLALL